LLIDKKNHKKNLKEQIVEEDARLISHQLQISEERIETSYDQIAQAKDREEFD
jgi:hypothetical protein